MDPNQLGNTLRHDPLFGGAQEAREGASSPSSSPDAIDVDDASRPLLAAAFSSPPLQLLRPDISLESHNSNPPLDNNHLNKLLFHPVRYIDNSQFRLCCINKVQPR